MAALWRGELALAEAFWTWAVLVALVVNVSTTGLFLALIAADRPWTALALGYALPVSYNVVALVGVWRSAARHAGPPAQADLARAASVILLTVLSLT
jgi:hypothetical protein